MERILIGTGGFDRVDSDLCVTVSGGKGGGLKRIWKAICENFDDFILGFIEGLTGMEIEKQLN